MDQRGWIAAVSRTARGWNQNWDHLEALIIGINRRVPGCRGCRKHKEAGLGNEIASAVRVNNPLLGISELQSALGLGADWFRRHRKSA